MDNASNCDTTSDRLPDHIPTYRGTLSRTRCFPHTVNLIAKNLFRGLTHLQAFIAFFFKQPKKKSKVTVAPGKRKRGARDAPPVIQPEEEREDPVVADVAVDEEGIMDEGKAAHDEATLTSIYGQAIHEAESKFALHMTVAEQTMALTIFPKVAGLARRVHDSPTLQEKFEKLVEANAAESGQKVALDRRVPTRWNSDLACLASHVHFERPVKQLTQDNLEEYALTAAQWKLAKELCQALQVFEDITKLFSQAEVPLVYEVIPMLEALEDELTNMRDDASLPDVIRIAAIAALLVIGKYYALSDDTEVYRIAIIMCPDKKLEWFQTNPGWRHEDRVEADLVVRARWTESYATRESLESSSGSQPATPAPV
ncbi:hypothetical protein C8F04DRAFT_975384 [Mycena alexandri]|uniref:Uncharacterized protein n=1 Tax=Mycena alexandri TaxID=1745969 RepID=A0AAD6S3L7_9AGAR|nr:hypothetical protein C8F04DRAFT_975395 [Mycena alexandri]KAJ7019661.1 hypothetical protein C8F04DRAFT_975384 [Mycena alexandri]